MLVGAPLDNAIGERQMQVADKLSITQLLE
jgi:hypothetical protein